MPNISSRPVCLLRKATIAVALAFSVCAAAQDPVAVSYADMHKVSIAEAQRRLSHLNDIARLEQQLQRESPDTFAGLYIEHHPTYRVVVKFTGDARSQLARFTKDSLFVAESSPRSFELLKSAQDVLAEEMTNLGIEFESGLNIKTSEIDVFVRDRARAADRMKILLPAISFIKLHQTAGFLKTTTLSGGNGLTGSTMNCTSGFNIVGSIRDLGITTAGHCANNVTYTPSPSVALAFQSEQNSGSNDVQWHKQPTAGTPQQQTNEITLIGGPQSSMKITGTTPSSALPLGSTVCKSGISGGYRCGEVADKYSQSNYNGSLGTYIRVHNISNQALSLPGDSGGPVFGSNIAYGTIHGRGAAGTAFVNDMYFMPVERLSTIGVSVVTSPFVIDTIPNVTGPQGVNIPATINFKGYPRFTVRRATKIVTCASGWKCSDYNGTYTSNVPSPLTFNFRCNNSTPLPTATFRWRTTLTDASGIFTNSV